jgi:hypothetical protein
VEQVITIWAVHHDMVLERRRMMSRVVRGVLLLAGLLLALMMPMTLHVNADEGNGRITAAVRVSDACAIEAGACIRAFSYYCFDYELGMMQEHYYCYNCGFDPIPPDSTGILGKNSKTTGSSGG